LARVLMDPVTSMPATRPMSMSFEGFPLSAIV
jgi:hypothetical protein